MNCFYRHSSARTFLTSKGILSTNGEHYTERRPSGTAVISEELPGLVALFVGEIQRTDGGDAYEQQDGGEQCEDNHQWSLLVFAALKRCNSIAKP